MNKQTLQVLELKVKENEAEDKIVISFIKKQMISLQAWLLIPTFLPVHHLESVGFLMCLD